MAGAPRYTVYLKPAAERALKKTTDHTARRRIAKAIDGLATTPRPSGVIAIHDGEGLLRIRAGDYRITDTVEDAALTVLVVTIGHRIGDKSRDARRPRWPALR